MSAALAPRPADAPPIALSIAGSDPGGGAGIQADLKTFSALGAYGTCVITALTAQNTRGVTGVHVVPTDFVVAQLDTLVADVPVDAVKIGMLATAELARAVGDFLRALPGEPGAGGRGRRPHVVLDPVMVATSGDRLLDEDAVAAIRELLPLADVVTPNLPEAAVLLDAPPATDLDGLTAHALALLDAGAVRVLAKGGHGVQDATDVLADGSPQTRAAHGGPRVTVYAGERIDTDNTHGTGCTLSSALAALRPRSDSWEQTVGEAKAWLTEALRAADRLHVGGGHGPVHHFHETWPRRR